MKPSMTVPAVQKIENRLAGQQCDADHYAVLGVTGINKRKIFCGNQEGGRGTGETGREEATQQQGRSGGLQKVQNCTDQNTKEEPPLGGRSNTINTSYFDEDVNRVGLGCGDYGGYEPRDKRLSRSKKVTILSVILYHYLGPLPHIF